MEKVCPSCPEEHKANLRDSVMKICTNQGCQTLNLCHFASVQGRARDVALEEGRGEF